MTIDKALKRYVRVCYCNCKYDIFIILKGTNTMIQRDKVRNYTFADLRYDVQTGYLKDPR